MTEQSEAAPELNMGELNQAAELAKGLAKQLRAIIAVGEALGQIANLDSARAEAKEQRDTAVQARLMAMHDLEQMLVVIEDAKAELNQLHIEVADAKPKAEAIAADIVGKAKREAADYLSSQKGAVDAMVAAETIKFAAVKAAHEAELQKLSDDIDRLTVSRDTLASEIKALRDRLAGV